MKRIFLIVIIAIVLGITGLAAFAVFQQSSNLPKNPPAQEPANVNVVFKYGVGAKNELNTFNQTYTKDMIADPPITISLTLSYSERLGIYQKIKELKLLEKKKMFTFSKVAVTPCSNYYLKIQVDAVEKELSWSDCSGKLRDEFQKFANYIIGLIESQEEYKKLPEPKGGYL